MYFVLTGAGKAGLSRHLPVNDEEKAVTEEVPF